MKGARNRPRWRRLLAVTGQLLLFGALFLALEAFLTRDAVRGPAPPLQGQTLSGHVVHLDQLVQQRDEPLLLAFWAIWCPLCRHELPMLGALSRDVNVLTVAMRSGSGAELATFVDEIAPGLPVLPDPDGRMAERFGVVAVPTLFIIDRQGQVRGVTRGWSTPWGLRIRLWWAGVLSG